MNDAAFEVLMDALLTGSPSNAIERQEARGQQVLVNSERLPKRCNRELFEAMGIVFGDDIDDLFVQATLPEGWKKVATDHSMWSKLVDGKGRERASIFYKAAFYDRDAFMNETWRFRATVQPVGGWLNPDFDSQTSPREAVVLDCNEVIWRSEPLAPSEELPFYQISDKLQPLSTAWLEEHYPNYRDPLAYWD